MPLAAKDLMRRAFTANYGLRAAHLGQIDALHRRTLELLDRSPCVTVQGQSDALLLGVVNLSHYSVGGIPIRSWWPTWGWATCSTCTSASSC